MISESIASQIVEGALRWDQGTNVDIIRFLKRFTLHDSMWIGLYTECAWQDTSVAVIQLDPVWNSSVSTPTSFVADWPLLFLRFSCISAIHLAGFSNIGGTQRGISGANAKFLSGEETMTEISDHYGGSVRLHHFPLIDALALSPEGLVLKLAMDGDHGPNG